MHEFNVNLYTILVLVALALILVFALHDTSHDSLDNIGDNNYEHSQTATAVHSTDQ